MTTETSQVLERPAVKWVMSVAQALCIAFIIWGCQSVASSVTSFSNKLDGVVKSIADFASMLEMQRRDTKALDQRVTRLESKTEALEQKVSRMTFQVEQLEKESGHGR